MKKPNKIIGSIFIGAILIVCLIVGYFYSRPKTLNDKEIKQVFMEDEENTVTESPIKEQKGITVYISGEIKQPGVYNLKNGSRVEELVKKAGGFTEGADKSKLNLAKKLKDEEHVQVLKDKAASGSIPQNSVTQSESEDKINLNTATKEDLKKVPGIGDVTAQKIIDFREKNGGFTSIEDLRKIDRMGEKTVNKLKEKLEVN